MKRYYGILFALLLSQGAVASDPVNCPLTAPLLFDPPTKDYKEPEANLRVVNESGITQLIQLPYPTPAMNGRSRLLNLSRTVWSVDSGDGLFVRAAFPMSGSGGAYSHSAIFFHHVVNYNGGFEYGLLKKVANSRGVFFYICNDCNTSSQVWQEWFIVDATTAQSDLRYAMSFDRQNRQWRVRVTRNDTGALTADLTINAPGWHPSSLPTPAYFTAVQQKFEDSNVSGDAMFRFPAICARQTTLPTVNVSIVDAHASETAPNKARLQISRTGPTSSQLSVSIGYTGAAQNGTDYTALSSALLIPAGASTVDLYVNPREDTFREGVERATIELLPSSAYNIGASASGSVDIYDNDYLACTSTGSTLCLQNGRFEATLQATVPGVPGTFAGHSVPLNGGASGAFWLFSANNIEVAVKVLDGSAINERFWVYHGAATDVGYTIQVKDRANPDQTRAYTKAPGSFCGSGDVGAFLKNGGSMPDQAPLEKATGAFQCQADSNTACLLGGRFQVRVKRDGVYQTIFQTKPETAFFSFFSAENMELFVKLLWGTNGHFWVFFGSLTDQPYAIEVTDTTTGAQRIYNSGSALCGGADTNAF